MFHQDVQCRCRPCPGPSARRGHSLPPRAGAPPLKATRLPPIRYAEPDQSLPHPARFPPDQRRKRRQLVQWPAGGPLSRASDRQGAPASLPASERTSERFHRANRCRHGCRRSQGCRRSHPTRSVQSTKGVGSLSGPSRRPMRSARIRYSSRMPTAIARRHLRRARSTKQRRSSLLGQNAAATTTFVSTTMVTPCAAAVQPGIA